MRSSRVFNVSAVRFCVSRIGVACVFLIAAGGLFAQTLDDLLAAPKEREPTKAHVEYAKHLGTTASAESLAKLVAQNNFYLINAYFSGLASAVSANENLRLLPRDIEVILESEAPVISGQLGPGNAVTAYLDRTKIRHRSRLLFESALNAVRDGRAQYSTETIGALLARSDLPDAVELIKKMLSDLPKPWRIDNGEPTQQCKTRSPTGKGQPRSLYEMEFLDGGWQCVYRPSPNGNNYNSVHWSVLLDGLAGLPPAEMADWWQHEAVHVPFGNPAAKALYRTLVKAGDRASLDRLAERIGRLPGDSSKESVGERTLLYAALGELPFENFSPAQTLYPLVKSRWPDTNIQSLELQTQFDPQAYRTLIRLAKAFEHATRVRFEGTVSGIGGETTPWPYRFIWHKDGRFVVDTTDSLGRNVIWQEDGCNYQYWRRFEYRDCKDTNRPGLPLLPPYADALLANPLMRSPSDKYFFLYSTPRIIAFNQRALENGRIELIGRSPGQQKDALQVRLREIDLVIESIRRDEGYPLTFEFSKMEIDGVISDAEFSFTAPPWARFNPFRDKTVIWSGPLFLYVGAGLVGFLIAYLIQRRGRGKHVVRWLLKLSLVGTVIGVLLIVLSILVFGSAGGGHGPPPLLIVLNYVGAAVSVFAGMTTGLWLPGRFVSSSSRSGHGLP